AAPAQLCTPTLKGFQSGPIDQYLGPPAFISALLPVTDASGPSLIAAGAFGLPPTLTGVRVGKYQNGLWTPTTAGLPTAGRGRALAQASFPGMETSLFTAGDYGNIYRWSGSTWTAVSNTPGTCYTLLPYTDAQGPVLLAGGTYGVLAWR